MERSKTTVLISIVILLFGITTIRAQDQNCQFLDYYITGDMSSWEKDLQQMKKKDFKALPENQLLNLCIAEYGFIGYLLGEEKEDEAEAHLEKAQKHIDRLLDLGPENAQYLSLKAAFVAFEISIWPYKAMYKGAESAAYIDKALAVDGTEPQAWLELGNSKFYTPKMFGGDKQEAIQHYKKVVRLMEEQGANQCNWLYPHVLVLVATAYLDIEDKEKAKQQFEKCLKLYPEFDWVKELAEQALE